MKNILKIKTDGKVRNPRAVAATQPFEFKRRAFDAVAYAAALEVLG